VVGGKPVFGCNHSELGHVRIARSPGDLWPGICRFHGDCVEGLASGPAIAARAGLLAQEIPDDNPVWELVAHALAQLVHTMVLATAPRRILVGGGVVQARPQILGHVRRLLIESLNGYLDLEELTGGVDRYVVPPGLGALAGPLGALALAADAYAMSEASRARAL
jgi:fructokinase